MAFSFFAWTTIALVVLTWVGYPLLLHVLVAVWGRRGTDMGTDVADGRPPSLTLLIAAHNAATVPAQKLENSLALDYPAERVEIPAASDRPPDRPLERARSFGSRAARSRGYDGARAGETGAGGGGGRGTGCTDGLARRHRGQARVRRSAWPDGDGSRHA